MMFIHWACGKFCSCCMCKQFLRSRSRMFSSLKNIFLWRTEKVAQRARVIQNIRAKGVGKCMCLSGMFDCWRWKKNKDIGSDSEMEVKQKCPLLSSVCWVKQILQREAFRFELASQLDSIINSAEDDEEHQTITEEEMRVGVNLLMLFWCSPHVLENSWSSESLVLVGIIPATGQKCWRLGQQNKICPLSIYKKNFNASTLASNVSWLWKILTLVEGI